MGSIFAEKVLYGSRAAITNPAKSGRASGSALHGMRTVSCDFIFGTVCSSAVQDRSRNERPPQSHSSWDRLLISSSLLEYEVWNACTPEALALNAATAASPRVHWC